MAWLFKLVLYTVDFLIWNLKRYKCQNKYDCQILISIPPKSVSWARSRKSLYENSHVCMHLHIKYFSLGKSIRTRVIILHYNTANGLQCFFWLSVLFSAPFYIHSTLDVRLKSALWLFIALLRPQRQTGWNIQGTGKVLLLLTHSL